MAFKLKTLSGLIDVALNMKTAGGIVPVALHAKTLGGLKRVNGAAPPEVAPAALAPMAASQPPSAIYSFDKINPAYAGNCMGVRDSGSVLRTLGFNGDGTLNTSAMSTYGDGVTFTIATWYDQSGNARDLTAGSRPKLIFPNAPANYLGGYVDFDAGSSRSFTSAATFLNVGGVQNISVHVVCKRLGYGSITTPHPRPGAEQASLNSSMIGYGTASANTLIGSVPTTVADTLGRSASAYGKPEDLPLDEAAPSATAGFTTMWMNQTGATVSGGGDSRKHWSSRPHGVADATAQRLVIGANGGLSGPMNGGVREVVIYNNGTAISDTEAWAVGIWQNTRYATQATEFAPRYYWLFSGQSNALHHMGDTVSGDGTVGSNSATRRFIPKFAEAMGIEARRVKFGVTQKTAVGGTPLLKREKVGDAPYSTYWWDEDINDAGPLATTVVGGYGGWGPTVDAISGIQYKQVGIVWAQGEEDSDDYLSPDSRADAWAAQTTSLFAWFRTRLGMPNAPVVIQPLSSYGAHTERTNYMRRLQKNTLSAIPNVVIAADTGHLARGADTQRDAHFGMLGAGAYDPATGGPEDGYQRMAWQDALAAAKAFGATVNYRGPEVASAAVTSASVIDVTLTYPVGCAGTDFSSASGTLGGFRAFTSGGDLAIASQVRLNATTVRVTLSAPVPAGASIAYEPNEAPYLTHIRDNNSVLPMPLATSDYFGVS